MHQKVVEFTNLLRKSGVRVSVAESIDAFRALDERGLHLVHQCCAGLGGERRFGGRLDAGDDAPLA
jgi:uncharacterized protein with von Willebrand factor type A (vWA) domain